MNEPSGIHHITAITGDTARNFAFYSGALGLKLIKKTVNFDDPSSWHLYYGDPAGSPGTVLTFFNWPHAAPGRAAAGQAAEIGFAIPAGAVTFWRERLASRGVKVAPLTERFGEPMLAFVDPDGQRLALIESAAALDSPGWESPEIPAAVSLRGFASVTLWVSDEARTVRLLENAFGWSRTRRAGDYSRLSAPGSGIGRQIDLRRVEPSVLGRPGRGSVHHVALRARNDARQTVLGRAVRSLGLAPTEQKDRVYFRSIYFRDTSGVLFEIATDEPGFATDEPAAELGRKLMLPPWLEPRRVAIAAALPPLD